MSKKKKVNKKTNLKSAKKNKRSFIILLLILGAVVILVSVIVKANLFSDSSKKNELCSNSWIASSARNASGDEVEMSEIYNTNYTSYQGSIVFNEDGTFSFWLSPGAPDDGSHGGKYVIKNSSAVDVTFDDGTVTEFNIERINGDISSIVANYNGYKVYFVNQ